MTLSNAIVCVCPIVVFAAGTISEIIFMRGSCAWASKTLDIDTYWFLENTFTGRCTTISLPVLFLSRPKECCQTIADTRIIDRSLAKIRNSYAAVFVSPMVPTYRVVRPGSNLLMIRLSMNTSNISITIYLCITVPEAHRLPLKTIVYHCTVLELHSI